MKIVFIVGTGRCGSSFIHELMALHQDTGFISNLDDRLVSADLLGRWNNTLFRAARGRWTKKGSVRFAPSEAYRLISKQVSPIYANSCRDLNADDLTPWLKSKFRDFFEKRWQAQGKGVFLHKYTGWSRVGFFADIFPEAKFIHIVRDGRAVVNSWLQMPWWDGYRGPEGWRWGSLNAQELKSWEESGCSYFMLAAVGWNKLMRSFEGYELELGADRMLTCRYEDFLVNPEEFMNKLFDWSGLLPSDMLDASFLNARVNLGRSDAYRRDLSFLQCGMVEKEMSEILGKYQYV